MAHPYRTTQPTALRVAAVLWLVVCLLFQTEYAFDHQVTAAMGTEVCSGEGMVRVSLDGKQLPANGHHHHDCCSASVVAILPGSPELPFLESMHPVYTETPVMHLALEWFGPLSRGPPASEV